MISFLRPSTEGFTKRTITPVMASLAELLRNTREYEEHYDWFIELARQFHKIQVGNFCFVVQDCLAFYGNVYTKI